MLPARPALAVASTLVAGLAPGVPRALAGRYRLVRLLARGGMAEVWEGQDDVLSRPVAVKILFPHLAADPALRERFRREAVTAARLVHPGIVAIFDAGVEVIGDNGATPGTVLSSTWSRDEQERLQMVWPEQPSTAFIVMELVPGETLKDLMARTGPTGPSLTVAIASQVTDALAHAHAQGLVHRDIKPANVLLRDEGPDLVRVKVADFGIATAAASTNDLTATGALLGTPKYISPEQVEGREPDARADLYSLGVVMFEMLSGHPPFKASSDMATALAHVQKPVPDLGAERPSLPPELVAVVSGLLVKDRDRRIGSALELAGALQLVRSRLGMPSSAPGANLRVPGRSPVPQREDADQQVDVPGRGALSAGTAPRTSVPGRTPGTGRSPRPAHTAARSGTSRGRASLVEREDRTLTDREPSPGPAPARTRRRSARAATVIVVALTLAGAAVVAAVLGSGPGTGARANSSSRVPSNGGGGHSSEGGAGRSQTALDVASVHELTENGLGPDHPWMLPNIIKPGSTGYWNSFFYKGPDFGGYGGLGIVFGMSGTPTVHSMQVTAPMRGWSAEVFTGMSDPTTVAGWGKPVARQTNIQSSTTFSLGARKAKWVLLWMLDPGPTRQAVIDKVVFH